ncbi:hypothetical protein DFS33DRAFT_1273707 [Desarmillaria ectypa]|nr:hypothetical protein DFS33DRAFT_1273707 [Desarmillaria ectypa]
MSLSHWVVNDWPYKVLQQLRDWFGITDAVHAEGSITYAQLWHLGRVSHPDPPEQIASGLQAAINAKEAGFDGVEIHVFHLQFLDPIIDGSHHAIKHDSIFTYALLLKNALVFGDAAFTAEEAARYVSEGKRAGRFRVPWIAYPNFAKRLEYGKHLDTHLGFTTLYDLGRDVETEKKGYIDYPPAEY